MLNGARRVRVTRHPLLVSVALLATLGLLLAACGGGNGGDGNGEGSGNVIRVAFANQTDATATLQLDDGEVTEFESCSGGVQTYELPLTDWTILVNGETAIDSLEQDPLILDRNLVAEVWLREDGSVDVRRVIPGSNIQPPARLAICT